MNNVTNSVLLIEQSRLQFSFGTSSSHCRCVPWPTLAIDPTNSISRPLAETHSGRHCSTGLWHITVSQDTSPPMRSWMDIGMCMTQHARIHTTRKPNWTVIRGLVGSVLGFGAAQQYTFPVKALFFGARFRILTSHILTTCKFCIMHITAANASLAEVCPVIPWYITAQWINGAHSAFPPMVYWWNLFGSGDFNQISYQKEKSSQLRKVISTMY